ncbi:MAG: ABC-F family ATP-binding cassette domain-containing protein [Candidatus Diapherotrites archaeon]|uniref:ABC-F family ATP-binding cassette domain-containing protein n=1 Tax=Candidatus Iainarchaeum sp. TaxID=3101447 RepID=A0A7K4BZN3_9ARCH|nr:ABC-F family ATP-binding cassette domain-containing protein [Candidatus Diapherotrites archaeon]
MSLSIKNLSINIGDREILNDQSVGFGKNAKVGLIGRNGVGKTTLLKAILGQVEYHGQISYHGRAAYFSQHIDLNKEVTAREIIGESATIHHQIDFESELKELEKLLTKPEVYEDQERVTKLTQKYVDLQTQMTKHQSTVPTNKIKSVLATLDVKEEWLDQKVSNLSTGQRAIIALAQILSSDAEILLLDEPTNHLDFKRLNILENFLKHYKGTVIIITHDRYFLNGTCNTIVKIENSKLIKYNGNYSAYLRMREETFLAQQKAYEREQEYLANERDKIARIGTSPLKVKQGKYRQKLLERREEIEKPDLDQTRFTAEIESKPIHANTVLELIDLSVGYDKPLISNINLQIGVNEKVILTGENGIGKSTLLKTIEGRIPALKGKVKLHSQGKMGYIDQELKDLKSNNTLYDEIHELTGDVAKTRQQLSIGGFYLEEDVFKPIKLLSLGEKARLNLIKVLIEKPNLLLLDEPTNHLDLDAREIIENAFLNYKGAILAISHDRYFIEKIANRVLKVENGEIKLIKQ